MSNKRRLERLYDAAQAYPDGSLSLLQSLQGRGISQKQLRETLNRLRAASGAELDALRHNISDWDMRAARGCKFAELRHVENVTLEDGSMFEWEIAHPSLLLASFVESSPVLQSMYAKVANANRETPWRLVIGFDEYVPGSKFLIDSNRKAMNLSFNFADLGPEAINHECTWMTAVSVRTKVMAKIPGGWSCLLRRFLNLQLFSPQGLATAGVPIRLFGEIYLLRAELESLVTDGDGHRSAFQWRGASSLTPCLRHKNVLKLNSGLAHRRHGFVEIDCEHHSEFVLVGQDELHANADSVIQALRCKDEGTISNARFTEICQACGLNTTPEGLLADVRLRQRVDFLRCMRYDWVHTCLQDGVMTKATQLFINASVSRAGMTFADWETYLQSASWHFPASSATKARGLHRVFNSYRIRDDSGHAKVKARPSEMLGLYGLLRHFVETRAFPAAVHPEMSVFVAGCKIVDICLAAKRQVVGLRQSAVFFCERRCVITCGCISVCSGHKS